MEIAFLILRFLLAAALYGFLGWAIWVLWQQIRLEARRSGEIQTPPINLVWDEDGQVSQRFGRPEVIIGRQPGSDLRLNEKAISARHARLVYHHGQWWVEDLHSKNGTFLNEERLTTAMVLTTGDALRCGNITLQIEIGKTSSQSFTGLSESIE